MKQYETGFLLSPNLPEEETEKTITQMAEIITQRNGKMIKQDRWGKKRLAYPIKRFQEAFYVFFLYDGAPDIPLELERRFKQMDSVIRFLTVKKDPRALVRKKKREDRAAAKVEAPAEELVAEAKSPADDEPKREEI
jgi:small subunit ribosomal protein S6